MKLKPLEVEIRQARKRIEYCEATCRQGDSVVSICDKHGKDGWQLATAVTDNGLLRLIFMRANLNDSFCVKTN